jgi:hypothetical protein
MNPAQVISEAQAAGVTIAVKDGGIVLKGTKAAIAQFVEPLKAAKPAVIALLAGQQESNAPSSSSAVSGYDEESGLPMDWIGGYRRLVVMRRPHAIPETTWTWLQAAAGELLTRWGRQLVAHGWGTLEVFGVHFEAPMPRVDCAGLLAMLSAHHKIEAVSAKSVSIRTESGALLRYYRPLAQNPGIVPVWELTTGDPPRSAGGAE